MPLTCDLESKIEALWERTQMGYKICGQEKPVLDQVISLLNEGKVSSVKRSENKDDPFHICVWVKKAILLFFQATSTYSHSQEGIWWDKISLLQLSRDTVVQRGIRIVPGAYVRQGVWLGHSVLVMPSFINIGAFIDERTMIDSGTTVGSCAFIGKRCHISSNVTIGGVLEPVQACPVIIGDDVFIGAGCHILEGMYVESGSILGAGVILTSGTKIIDRTSGKIFFGKVPSGSVLVPGSYVCEKSGLSIHCAVVVKTVDHQTRQKTQINDLLRV